MDLGDRGIRVVIELHVGLDDGAALCTLRHEEVDAFSFGDRLLQWRRDEALDQFAACAGIGRGDGHHRVADLRKFTHLQRGQGPQPDHEDQQADDAREHRAPNKVVGELHCRRVSASGSTELSTEIA